VKRPNKVVIRRLPTGVRGLDEIMGGGLSEFSFNIIAGQPGCGKTTLAHQIIFANATVEKPALYFTVLGEPAIKMLRYQQQYSFFDPSKLNTAIRFINLSKMVLNDDLGEILKKISSEVEASSPGMVVIDSFRTVGRTAKRGQHDEVDLQSFTQSLAMLLTGWQATTFLIGEYTEAEMQGNLIFTVCDGLFWLSQCIERNSVVRKLQVIKIRGQESVPGLHTIRIGSFGIQAFSRTMGFVGTNRVQKRKRRLSWGNPELDKMMSGGVPEGDSVLLAGPSGTGKTALATEFVEAGLRMGESAIMAIFEERPEGYVARAKSLGIDLLTPQKDGKLEILYLRPLDLSVDETMQEILDAVSRTGAKRLVIDSLVGFEMALTPGFRTDFRESLYRMIGALTGAGVTIISTVEIEDTFTSFEFSHYTISFLTDDIIRLRYVEIDGEIRKILVVAKMRGGNHSKSIREYTITNKGLVISPQEPWGYGGLTTGIPRKIRS
jgi:circadian clock protein KaiC